MENFINTEAIKEYIIFTTREAVAIETRKLRLEMDQLRKEKTVKEVLSLDEAAEYLDRSTRFIRDKYRTQVLPGYKDGKRLYFKTSDLNRLITGNTNNSRKQA